MAFHSPIVKESLDVSISNNGNIGAEQIPENFGDGQPAVYTLYVTCDSGEVTIRFYEDDNGSPVEITGGRDSRKTLPSGKSWSYNFGIAGWTPDYFDIHDETGSGSQVDYRLERSESV